MFKQEEMETKLSRLSELSSKEGRIRFTSLIHLINEANLKACFWELKRNKAPGVDWISWDEYCKDLDDRIGELHSRMLKWQYRPQPVRRVYIPKSNGGKRPLGIPAIEDKMVQMMMTKIMTAIYEPLFLDCSYGFRPGRSAHKALRTLNREMYGQPVSYVIDADIKGFFDNVDHKWLVKFLEHKIADKNMVRLIVRFLKSGIMEDGKRAASRLGTPQGGILSPILANIYLHYVLDVWFTHHVRPRMRGYCILIRYADDFVILARYREDAQKLLGWLGDRLKRFGLSLCEEKSGLVEFGRFADERSKRKGQRPGTFDFLGFTHFVSKTREGRFKVGRKTTKKKFGANLKRMSQWLRQVRNTFPIAEIWKLLGVKVSGYYRYYGVSENYNSLKRYDYELKRLVFKWMNRRSERKSFTWEQFKRYLCLYPLPNPKIYHNLYEYA